jgi:hypothetical protein
VAQSHLHIICAVVYFCVDDLSSKAGMAASKKRMAFAVIL